jgi:flagellar biosynthetic protein FlhB
MGKLMAGLLWPIFLLTLVVGFLASFLQVGPLFTLKPFEPDINKFNPIKGMAKFVSKRSAVELVKSLAKVSLIGFVAYKTVANEFDTALTLINLELSQSLIFLGQTAFLVMAKTSGILIVLAIIDYAFTKYEMEQKMKMTKQEVKEEFKETEGDPQIKARVRSMQQQMARKRMMAEVPQADVVITNPTHLSIAIKYDREAMDAPTIIAKGGDHLAFRIREIAKEHKVPIVENKPVARALYTHEVGEQIPEEMFMAVAEVLAYVYGLKNR